MRILMLSLLIFASGALAFEDVDDIYTPTPEVISITPGDGPIWDGPYAQLFSSGPYMNSAGTGSGGADESRMTASETTYGPGCQLANTNRCADDFTVPAGQTWSITSVTLFGYQTNSGINPTINACYLTIYSGDNPTSGVVVYGDYTTNRFASASWTNCYRVSSSEYGTGTARPIMAVIGNVTTTLTAGNYWMGWSMNGTGSSGPWNAPVVNTPPGGVTGNAQQYTGTSLVWAPLLMGGTSLAYGCPFILSGTMTGLERTTWGAIKTIF
jgi:hypothetical protein